MLWEKKIQLGKETAEAIDPNVGREDINRMKKEIHIMELRYGRCFPFVELVISRFPFIVFSLALFGGILMFCIFYMHSEQQLKRDILQLTEEMERAISKREIIGLSFVSAFPTSPFCSCFGCKFSPLADSLR